MCVCVCVCFDFFFHFSLVLISIAMFVKFPSSFSLLLLWFVHRFFAQLNKYLISTTTFAHDCHSCNQDTCVRVKVFNSSHSWHGYAYESHFQHHSYIRIVMLLIWIKLPFRLLYNVWASTEHCHMKVLFNTHGIPFIFKYFPLSLNTHYHRIISL